MARWTDIAEWVGPTVNQAGPMVEHRGLVVHIAQGSYVGTVAWQRNPAAEVSSHFIVSKTGHIGQMVDTDVTAWTQAAGNGHWLSIENEGSIPAPLTAAQIEANAIIYARGVREYGWPLQLADTPSGRGLGYHSMGSHHGFADDWGHADCPGPAIIAQRQQILTRAAELGDIMLTETMPGGPLQGHSVADVLNVLLVRTDYTANHFSPDVKSLIATVQQGIAAVAQGVQSISTALGTLPDMTTTATELQAASDVLTGLAKDLHARLLAFLAAGA
jgi:hypothetical protein